MEQILTPKTAADQSSSFFVRPGAPVTVKVDGLVSGENADIQEYVNGSWQDAYDKSGVQIRIAGPGTGLILEGEGAYRVDKETTASNVGVFIACKNILEAQRSAPS